MRKETVSKLVHISGKSVQKGARCPLKVGFEKRETF